MTKKRIRWIRHLNDDKNDRGNIFSTCAEKRLQCYEMEARWRQDDVKKIWLNNLNRLNREFVFVKRAEGYRRQMQSGPRFDEHLASLAVDACCFGLIFFFPDLFLLR